jgi:hypothetical protein
MASDAERQFSDLLRRMGDDLLYWKDRAEVAEKNLVVATKALRDIGSNDYVNGGSDIAWRALEAIEGTDEEVGEALERQRQPENQPIPELTAGRCFHSIDSRSCMCEE